MTKNRLTKTELKAQGDTLNGKQVLVLLTDAISFADCFNPDEAGIPTKLSARFWPARLEMG